MELKYIDCLSLKTKIAFSETVLYRALLTLWIEAVFLNVFVSVA